MKRIGFQSRDNRGAAMIGLCLSLFLILAILGFFVYDMNRMQMAQRQLTALCDAAALAGSSMLSSQDVSYEDANEDTLYNAQATATQYAKNMFCTGTILGARLYDSSFAGTGVPVSLISTAAALTPIAANKVNLFIQLADPSTGYTAYTSGNSQGRAFVVQAVYGYTPCLNNIGIGTALAVPAKSTAATQLMNVVMVFDCSGSMDDQTSVTFVDRIWNWNSVTQSGTDQYNYKTVTTATSAGNNTLVNYTGLSYAVAPNGTPLNVLPPQNLTDLGYLYNGGYNQWGDSGTSGYYAASPPLAFDWSMRAYVATPGNSQSFPYSNGGVGVSYTPLNFPGPLYDNDFGTPPGNCELKYGSKQTFANPWSPAGVTCWDGLATHGWGPGAPTGYTGFYNAAVGTPQCDNNRYFYDPNSIPAAYSGSAYAPFTDMVVNLVQLSWTSGSATNPCTAQPLTASTSSSFTGFTQTFPSTTFNVFFAEGSGGTSAYNYESDTQLENIAFKFTNIAYLVEASRGNLDLDNNGKATNYTNALLNYKTTDLNGLAMPVIGDCKTGYQKAYQRLAMYVSQPFATAQAGAFKFFQNLAQTSAAYFGFIGFSATPANYTGNPDTCAYFNGTSLFYSCTGTPSYLTHTYADFFYHGSVASATTPTINPNVWMWSPMIVSSASGSPPADGAAGPAGSPTGIPYSATYNTGGPGNPGGTTANTWLKASFGSNTSSAPAGTNGSAPGVNWAYTNPGFQIPRCFLANSTSDTATGTNQQATFNGVCSNETMSIYSTTGTNTQGDGTTASNAGYNGLFHCRPLTDTGSLEAIETALANLGVSTYALTPGYTASNYTATNQRAGAINVIVFFTDGTPTDANNVSGVTNYANYSSAVITPAQQNGIPIYSIGLALNTNVQQNQYTFLNTLTNNGANGSQFFQVTNAASLTAAFTGIAKQLTQCLR